MAISKVTIEEKRIIRAEVNKLLKALEKKFNLRGLNSKERFRWDQDTIIVEIVEQVGGALKI